MSKKSNRIICFIYIIASILLAGYMILLYSFAQENPSSTESIDTFLIINNILQIGRIALGVISIIFVVLTIKAKKITVAIGYIIACLLIVIPNGFAPFALLIATIIISRGNKKYISEEDQEIKKNTDWFYEKK